MAEEFLGRAGTFGLVSFPRAMKILHIGRKSLRGESNRGRTQVAATSCDIHASMRTPGITNSFIRVTYGLYAISSEALGYCRSPLRGCKDSIHQRLAPISTVLGLKPWATNGRPFGAVNRMPNHEFCLVPRTCFKTDSKIQTGKLFPACSLQR